MKIFFTQKNIIVFGLKPNCVTIAASGSDLSAAAVGEAIENLFHAGALVRMCCDTDSVEVEAISVASYKIFSFVVNLSPLSQALEGVETMTRSVLNGQRLQFKDLTSELQMWSGKIEPKLDQSIQA